MKSIQEQRMRPGTIYVSEEQREAAGMIGERTIAIQFFDEDEELTNEWEGMDKKDVAIGMIKNNFDLFLRSGITPEELDEMSQREWAHSRGAWCPSPEIDYPIVEVKEIIYD